MLINEQRILGEILGITYIHSLWTIVTLVKRSSNAARTTDSQEDGTTVVRITRTYIGLPHGTLVCTSNT